MGEQNYYISGNDIIRNGFQKLDINRQTHRNVNRLIDTKGMNRISGKPLKTRGSGTRAVAGIPCLLLGPCQGSMGGAAVANGHSGRKSDPSERYLRSSDTLEKK